MSLDDRECLICGEPSVPDDIRCAECLVQPKDGSSHEDWESIAGSVRAFDRVEARICNVLAFPERPVRNGALPRLWCYGDLLEHPDLDDIDPQRISSVVEFMLSSGDVLITPDEGELLLIDNPHRPPAPPDP